MKKSKFGAKHKFDDEYKSGKPLDVELDLIEELDKEKLDVFLLYDRNTEKKPATSTSDPMKKVAAFTVPNKGEWDHAWLCARLVDPNLEPRVSHVCVTRIKIT